MISVSGISYAQFTLNSQQLKSDPYAWYDRQNDQQNSGLVNGEYVEIKRISKSSHQFFGDDSWVLGKIQFRKQYFDSVYLTYDINTDLLLIRHPSQYIYHSQAIKPVQEQVEWFQIMQHQFIRIDDKNMKGFYDVLYHGKSLNLYAKRHKNTYVERSVEFESDDKYFLQLQEEYFPLRRKGSITKLFAEYKKEIKDYINQNRLVIKPGNDNDYVQIIEFMDGIIRNNP